MSQDEEIFSVILEKYYSNMTAAEQRIADYLLKNPHESITFSVTSLAEKVHTSEATVVRFAKTLGFKGFLELKTELLKRASRVMAPQKRYETQVRTTESNSVPLMIADQEVANINTTMVNLSQKEFDCFAAVLKKAGLIYCVGSGMSSFLARMAAYQLILTGKRSLALSDSASGYEEQLGLANPKTDILLIFSFPPYSKSTLSIADYAAEKGMTCLAFTDRRTSPIAIKAKHSLHCANESRLPFNSVSASLVLLQALMLQLSAAKVK